MSPHHPWWWSEIRIQLRLQPDPALLARFEIIFMDFPDDERPTDVVWNCPEPPHTCEVEASLASNEQIAAFMHALEDNPQAEVDEIPTIYLQQLRSTEEGEKHFTLVLELP